MMSREKFLIALEGGGTRSQVALIDQDGRLIHSLDAGDVNTNFTSFEQAQNTVQSAIRAVLHAVGVPGELVVTIVSALVGPRFGAETLGATCPNAAYFYYTERDVVFARAGIYKPHGLAVVTATGATAWVVRADDGRQRYFGGWGSLLGDEGSAYQMGLLGLRAAVMAFEGRESAPTRLVEALCERLDLPIDTFQRRLIQLAYGKPLSRADIAGLAVMVTALAAEGDVVALRITAQVANDLAALALHAAGSLFDPAEAFDVAVAGGLVNAGDLMLGPLRERMQATYPNAVITIGVERPAVALGRLFLFHRT
jgi:N-acetylglucosamine kinase-like BadF-type ATPase